MAHSFSFGSVLTHCLAWFTVLWYVSIRYHQGNLKKFMFVYLFVCLTWGLGLFGFLMAHSFSVDPVLTHLFSMVHCGMFLLNTIRKCQIIIFSNFLFVSSGGWALKIPLAYPQRGL